MGGSVENEHRIPLETLPTELQGALAVRNNTAAWLHQFSEAIAT